jgi:hypothetical protein
VARQVGLKIFFLVRPTWAIADRSIVSNFRFAEIEIANLTKWKFSKLASVENFSVKDCAKRQGRIKARRTRLAAEVLRAVLGSGTPGGGPQAHGPYMEARNALGTYTIGTYTIGTYTIGTYTIALLYASSFMKRLTLLSSWSDVSPYPQAQSRTEVEQ